MPPSVVIHHYDPVWPERYVRERARLTALLGARLSAIAHVGSTAVPGLAARPVIDVAVGVADLAADGPPCAAALAEAGWERALDEAIPLGDEGEVGWTFRLPGSADDACRLYLVEADGPAWADLLLFRDYLRAHPRAGLAYQQLKHVLVARSADRRAYMEGKSGFVTSILAIARTSPPPLGGGLGEE